MQNDELKAVYEMLLCCFTLFWPQERKRAVLQHIPALLFLFFSTNLHFTRNIPTENQNLSFFSNQGGPAAKTAVQKFHLNTSNGRYTTHDM